ncbi:hypothetical protein Y032_0267g735 [Ancylostoma ceylanicum]|uniref:Uncharacterized protein n=1 Tax=Ancylostoma ceylanicum TaxID=53326 RepID=A0A016S9W7_9BILA|nr:hypothetical protein Y032_0267g735 [Ancylostoma ceylanicum]
MVKASLDKLSNTQLTLCCPSRCSRLTMDTVRDARQRTKQRLLSRSPANSPASNALARLTSAHTSLDIHSASCVLELIPGIRFEIHGRCRYGSEDFARYDQD